MMTEKTDDLPERHYLLPFKQESNPMEVKLLPPLGKRGQSFASLTSTDIPRNFVSDIQRYRTLMTQRLFDQNYS